MQAPAWQRYLPSQNGSQYLNLNLNGFYRQISYTIVIATVCLIALYEILPHRPYRGPPRYMPIPHTEDLDFTGKWNVSRDWMNFRLTNEECTEAFPGLYADIDRAILDRRGTKISLEELEQVPKINGYVRGMIYNQQLFIIDKHGGIYSRELATLSALNRAIVTSPEPLPNIEFTFISDDKISPRATWAYARRAKDKAVWLIPDFGFWSWPETKVGSYNGVREKAIILEDGGSTSSPNHPSFPFRSKHDKLVWRGATMNLPLRQKFLDATANKPWSDVKVLKWHDDDSMAHDLLSMADHCKYKFVAHTEGNAYSGRLKYLQNCRSVVVAHSMDWIQHYQHLMRSSGPERNYVEVKRDFSDLDEKMQYMLAHEEEAGKIADNSVRMFRERYLTPAAQACYWRRLVYGWASMSFEPSRWDENGELRGLSFEDFVLERRLDWKPY